MVQVPFVSVAVSLSQYHFLIVLLYLRIKLLYSVHQTNSWQNISTRDEVSGQQRSRLTLVCATYHLLPLIQTALVRDTQGILTTVVIATIMLILTTLVTLMMILTMLVLIATIMVILTTLIKAIFMLIILFTFVIVILIRIWTMLVKRIFY